ncbi:MAG TPA: CGNR zinc finger domain-containing protein [Pseudonocardiaceae bacterium]
MTAQMSGVHVEPLTTWDAQQDIDLVLAFLNTVDHEKGVDVLDGITTWQRWIDDHGLPPGAPEDLAATRHARDALRVAAGCTVTGDGEPTGAGWPVRIRLDTGIPHPIADDALGAVLLAAYRLVLTGHWERIKICPATNCRWAFYDRSRNRSRTWCSMRVCGNREKARNWRERARSAAAAATG